MEGTYLISLRLVNLFADDLELASDWVGLLKRSLSTCVATIEAKGDVDWEADSQLGVNVQDPHLHGPERLSSATGLWD